VDHHAHWASLASFISSCGASLPGGRGSASPSPQRSTVSRPCIPRTSTAPWRNGRMTGRLRRRLSRVWPLRSREAPRSQHPGPPAGNHEGPSTAGAGAPRTEMHRAGNRHGARGQSTDSLSVSCHRAWVAQPAGGHEHGLVDGCERSIGQLRALPPRASSLCACGRCAS